MRNSLAIHGGEKTVKLQGKHYVWPPITKETEQAVLRQLHQSISVYDKSGIIDRLETRFADYHGKKHALLTNSGTMALYSAFIGANLKPGDEVICPAYTFFATVTPLFSLGVVPVLVDARTDGNIDPSEIERRITEKTRAIIVTHMWGLPCEMDGIVKIAQAHGLLLFEDASHAHGATYKGRRVGTFGDAVVFSLQGQKMVTGGEGGVLLTDHDDIFYRALLLGHYNRRCKNEIPQDHPLYPFATTGMGLKLRIHPIAAAMADQQFNHLERILTGRRSMALKMRREFGNLSGIEVPHIPEDVNPTWYGLVMQYKPEELDGLPVERFYQALIAEGCIELDRPGSTCPLNFHPLFQNPAIIFPAYEGKMSYRKGDFPVAEKFHEKSLKVPVWHEEKDENIVNLYVKAFQKVITNYKQLL